ncbi:hypothetical protein [Mucilaginibacter terrae]|uniref:DUF3021 domain-containing protein n=1 Tax=Mucilaginibacter terrae TaxID=1955052 RepID=A0ABU3GVC9_9SPHI|nr:hypothetical protein [Mucilaginibacter terrae]MDT3402590.1 hypothetical protein [Mucilaginibacter terrae]
MNTFQQHQYLRNRIKVYMWIVITGLALSGITAFPLETELQWLCQHASVFPVAMQNWLNTIYQAIHHTNVRYPYLSYGTDWLAFAHIMLAILFIGPLMDPVKNVWVIQFGMIACVLIFPLAFIAGPVRHIPLFWRFIDSSFGVFAFIPLWLSYRKIRLIEAGRK